MNSADFDNMILNLAAVLFIIALLAWRWWSRHRAADVAVDSSIILTAYTMGTKLNKISSGMLGGYPYDIMITEAVMPNLGPSLGFEMGRGMAAEGVADVVQIQHAEAEGGRIVMITKMPVASPVHITGLGLEDDLISKAINSMGFDKILARVELEGDFPDYFRLYCTKGYDVELREILDPTAMQFLVDYCQHTQWEIFEDYIYFSDTGQSSKNQSDHATIAQDAQDFVTKVLPILRQMKDIGVSN